MRHHKDAKLKQEIHRQCNDEEREDVGRWSDDSRQNHQYDDGMTAIVAQEVGGQQSRLSQEPAENREFEDDAQHEVETGEGAEIRLEGDEVVNLFHHLIGAEETEGEGEDDEVAHHNAEHKHDIGAQQDTASHTPLFLVKTRRGEPKELEHDVRQDDEHGDVHRHTHMKEKLSCQLGVDDAHREAIHRINTARKERQQSVQPTVETEVGRLGSGHQGEELLLEAERRHSHYYEDKGNTD